MQQIVHGHIGFLQPRTRGHRVGGEARPRVGWLDVGSDAAGWRRLAVLTFDAEERKVGFAVDMPGVDEVCLARIRALQESGEPEIRQTRETHLMVLLHRIGDQVQDLADFEAVVANPVQLPYSGTAIIRAVGPVELTPAIVDESPQAWRKLLTTAM